MWVRCVGIETCILHFVNQVDTIWVEFVFYPFEFVAYYEGFELNPQFVGKLAPFGEQFKAHIGHLPIIIFAINDNVILTFDVILILHRIFLFCC